MCNGTWVCFDCRLAKRRPTWTASTATRPLLAGTSAEGVRCGKCGGACHYLGPDIEVPAKRDVQAWNRLRKRLAVRRVGLLEKSFRQSVRRRHDLEQRLRDLMARPKNHGRDLLIKQLRKQLAGNG